MSNNQKINFIKMSGAGNSFVIIDNCKMLMGLSNYGDYPRIAMNLCKKNKVDGMLLLENSKKADFKMRIFNPDGTEAEMCGNGIRCISYFAYKKGIVSKKMKIETLAGIIYTEVDGNFVRVKMNKPTNIRLNLDLLVNGKKYICHHINTGVPHTILFVDRVNKIINLNKIGKIIRYHPNFARAGTNVNFVETLNKNKIKIRTYERGVERETLACGTGATASSIISETLGKTKFPTEVLTKGKESLVIEKDKKNNVYMSGPVREVKDV